MREDAGRPHGRHGGKLDLRGVARRAMTERSLLPDFSGAAMVQVARLSEADAVAAALAASPL